MRSITVFASLILAASAALGQQWSFGALAGGGLLNNVSATSPAGSATAGFAPGFVAGLFAGENMYSHISGEFHYEYMQSDPRLSSGGQSAQFSGVSHSAHYDVAYHSNRGESAVQFFGSIGGGVKAFLGTGTQEAYQPLSQYGYFTNTTTVKPMGDVGGGVTIRLSAKLSLRAEVRDFVMPFPATVLTPPPGVKYGSLLNEIVPMVGIVYGK
jgi:hypothetical protein